MITSNLISYIRDHRELIKNLKSPPIQLTKLTKSEIRTVRGDDQNHNFIFIFRMQKFVKVIHPSGNILQKSEQNSFV